jgi:hypothetical protein
MKRSVKTSATAIIGRGELVLEISQNEFGKWALEFTLLLEGLANSVEMRIGAENRLRIRLTNEPHTDRLIAIKSGTGDFEFIVPRTQAEYLQATLLRAYRDEMAEVNHVHAEGFIDGKPFDLTIMFDVYKPPMTAEEAEREILGTR